MRLGLMAWMAAVALRNRADREYQEANFVYTYICRIDRPSEEGAG